MNSTDSEQDYDLNSFVRRRLKKILFTTQCFLLFVIAQRFYFSDYTQAIILFSFVLLLSTVYLASDSEDPKYGGSMFSIIAFIAMLYFMWRNEGVRDETLLAFPALFTFAVMLGHRMVAITLLAMMLINIIVMGYMHDAGLVTFFNSYNSLASAVLVATLISMSCYWVWRIAFELRESLTKLSEEHNQLLVREAEIKVLAQHDYLTKLPNRSMAKIFFNQAMKVAKRRNVKFALMFLDLDEFKSINDSLGHEIGDEYLVHIAEQLKNRLRKTDSVCRLGGDEFLVILEHGSSKANIAHMAEKIVDAVKQPVKIGGHIVSGSVTVGIAMVPDDGADFDTICRKADLAMYHGKGSGKNSYHFFDDKMSAQAIDSLNLISELRSLHYDRSFELLFQPQINLQTGEIVSAEALLRWHHGDRGIVLPSDFIPLAEKSGEIVNIGKWVLQQACKHRQSWKEQTGKSIQVAVNISPIQLRHKDFHDFVVATLSQHKMPPSQLTLEFTESLLMANSYEIADNLAALRKTGVHLSIDDFGTGYSNLGYLKNFNIESLKIDKSFVFKATESNQDSAIIKAIIQMASSLGINTVAEGIEDVSTGELCRNLNCTLGQGYFWSKPLANDKFLQFVENQPPVKSHLETKQSVPQ